MLVESNDKQQGHTPLIESAFLAHHQQATPACTSTAHEVEECCAAAALPPDGFKAPHPRDGCQQLQRPARPLKQEKGASIARVCNAARRSNRRLLTNFEERLGEGAPSRLVYFRLYVFFSLPTCGLRGKSLGHLRAVRATRHQNLPAGSFTSSCRVDGQNKCCTAFEAWVAALRGRNRRVTDAVWPPYLGQSSTIRKIAKHHARQ